MKSEPESRMEKGVDVKVKIHFYASWHWGIYLSEFSGFAVENPHSGEDSLQLDNYLLITNSL